MLRRLPAVTHPEYSYQFPSKHRFAMSKFGLLVEYLKDSGIYNKLDIHRPGTCPDKWMTLAHCPNYLDRFRLGLLSDKEQRRIGLPWSQALVRRSLISPSGTIYAAQLALTYGLACHLAGGTHHAHRNYGSGFCILNDLAICALKLLQQDNVNRVLIFDCDVHQGDGTATILANEPRAFTCSLHCEKNFPARKSQSDFDVNIPVGTKDEKYLSLVNETLLNCLERHQPDIVLYDAGVDVYSGDPLGLLEISEVAIAARDRFVIETCMTMGVPVATVIGGGYDKNHDALAKRHGIIVKECLSIWNNWSH